MNSRAIIACGVALLGAVCAWAAQPLGQIRGAEPFSLAGQQVPVGGMRSWPLVSGDVIATAAGAAIIEFRDGSKATLASRSRAKVESVEEDRIVLRLIAGGLEYRLKPDSRVSVYKGQVRQTAATGKITVGAAVDGTTSSSGSGKVTTQALPPLSRWR